MYRKRKCCCCGSRGDGSGICCLPCSVLNFASRKRRLTDWETRQDKTGEVSASLPVKLHSLTHSLTDFSSSSSSTELIWPIIGSDTRGGKEKEAAVLNSHRPPHSLSESSFSAEHNVLSHPFSFFQSICLDLSTAFLFSFFCFLLLCTCPLKQTESNGCVFRMVWSWWWWW